jgi:hypothetical protein
VTDHPPDRRRPTFILRIEGRPGTAGIHALRAILKVLLRKHGFRCLDAREDVAPDVSNQIADAFTELRRSVEARTRRP